MAKRNACQVYEERFNTKIDALKDHPQYGWLRQYANDALAHHTGFGILQIKATDFMDRIIKKPLSYIEAWLNGENALEW